ncbi:MAG: FtsH protease activity modulator HflK [Deltaproteobacteria bacterium]|nr:FtsH protease activity modulator HflK [Deltaproteobacteria bacterium]
MASDERPQTVEAAVRTRVRTTLLTVFAWVVALGLLGAWASTGVYTLRPGQEAVILRFGEYARTVADPGPQIHLPPPIESHAIVNTSAIERQEFGTRSGSADAADAHAEAHLESAMQTSDNNLVVLGFVVQYRIQNAFDALYRVSSAEAILRDAAQAAAREVVGRTTIDGVLSEQRGRVEAETEETLQALMERYRTGLVILAVQLQEVQPPQEVRAAFDDVIAASQDKNRTVNEAQGFANEVVPKARGEASEHRAQAEGYKAARIAGATGGATRFLALAGEYAKAPEVTRTRLYLETMEDVLPTVDKYVIEPGAAGVVPYLPLGRDARTGTARHATEPAVAAEPRP